MIDIESELFTLIREKVLAAFPNALMAGEYVKMPSQFPFITFEELDNSTYRDTQDSGSLENHASLMYMVNVYSSKANGKKSECKAIANLIDEAMQALGFDRTMKEPVPNLNDATIYRIVMRYRAIVSADHTIYRR